MKYLVFPLFVFISFLANGQSRPVTKIAAKDTALYNLQKSVYNSALKYSDLSIAKSALYTMIAINPADKTLKDTLLFLYLNAGSFGQSVLLSREILAENPNNTTVQEIKAVSEQNLGLTKEALESYEKLYGQTKNVFHLYQTAVLQYQLKRYGECNANIDEIVKNEKANSERVNINMGQNGASQEVVLKAAAYNIKGVMLLEAKREDEAKIAFAEALKIQPDFELAKNNLALTEKKSTATPSKAPVKKPAGK